MIASPIPIPTSWQQRYFFLRFFMYFLCIVMAVLLASRFFFPTITQNFDFRSPESSKNMLLAPRSPENTPRTNGKIESKGTLVTDTAVVGDFSLVTVTAVLEKKSTLPETLSVSLRRSYQSFLYPTGEPVSDFPNETIMRASDTYYLLRDDTLFPFVSEQAYLSRFPKERASIITDTVPFFERFSVSDTWFGFRVGTLLSNANGVFVVVSETEVRPIGSADIFLSLGYNFADVIPVNEEELGVYQQGRILLLGAPHPDGTVLHDPTTDDYFLIQKGTKKPLLPGIYRDFLLETIHPIIVSSQASAETVHCTLTPTIFRSAFSCTTPITTLIPGFGNDFELRMDSASAIDLNTLSVSFETAKNRQNILTLLSQMKQRLLARFGATE